MSKKVRNWLFAAFVFCAVAAGVLAVILNVTKPDSEKTFNELVLEDFARVKGEATDSIQVCFYEVETVLNNDCDSVSVEDLKVIEMLTVAQVGDSVMFIHRDILNDVVEVTKVADMWVGDVNITNVVFPVSFEDALKLAKESEFGLPGGNKMTLRSPLYRELVNPKYIFGQHNTSFVAVDAITGEVSQLSVNELEASQEDTTTTVVE